MQRSKTLVLFLFLLVSATAAQIPIATHIKIVKAEDARRYDQMLEGLLASPNAVIRRRAALAAGRIGNDAAIGKLAELLRADSAVPVREMAAFAIGEIESVKGADPLIDALRDANTPAAVRARAVEAAGKIVGANAKDPKAATLGEMIVKTLSDATDVIVERLALTAILRARPRGAEETVRKSLAHHDPYVVADALNTLARLRAKNANRDARDLLETHLNSVVRANAARVLGAAEDKDAIDVLIKAATKDVDSRVRVSAIRSLAALKDAKAAGPLLARGETLLAAYKAAKKPNFIPSEQNEFIEIATALGRVLANTRDERAVRLLREFGRLDQGLATEAYIARVRIAPARGDKDKPELTHWRQYSTIAQIVGEFANLEPTDEEGKQMKIEAPAILGPLAKAYAEADPKNDADTILAAPDVLRAFAGFKTQDLPQILRTALTNKDIFIRATAAELIAELPATQDNLDALNVAFDYAIQNDIRYNDAVLATLEALFKLDKRKSLSAVAVAAGSPDHLVRKRAYEMLNDDVLKTVSTVPPMIQYAETNRLNEVRPYAGKGTQLGQILNKDADYRRALTRKNGSVRAIVATAKGSFTIEFLPEDAPLTVDNFIGLARSGYFNGLEVHRVVSNFVMQDGDPRGDGNGGPGWSIRCEINMVPYDRGAVGMALSGKDTGGSQWFVTHSPQPHLDGGYTVFGRVNEAGMKVVDKIVRGDKILRVKVVEGNPTQSSRRPRS